MNETAKTLCHEWSKSKKHNYNVEYYKKNKSKWEKYNHSERRALGDNASRLSRAENMLDFAKSRYERAYDLRREAFDAAKKNKDMAVKAQAAGIPKAAEALRRTAYDKYREAHDYLDQQNYIEKKQVNPREGDVAYLRTMRDKGYGAASSRPVSSARVDKTVGSHDRGDYKYVSKSFEKIATKADELRRKANWKTAPIKNKATRKAKEFVSNWKSGANSISSAVKSTSSKLGKSFLRW